MKLPHTKIELNNMGYEDIIEKNRLFLLNRNEPFTNFCHTREYVST